MPIEQERQTEPHFKHSTFRAPERVTVDYADQFAAQDSSLYNLPT
jgi:hypothetical protein